MGYCTVDEVLARMGHSGATSTDLTADIEDAINDATTGIDDDCDRVFTASTATREFKTIGYGNVLHLPDFTAITTLKVDDDDDGVFETTISASEYELRKSRDRTDWPYDRIALLDRHFPYGGRRQYRVEVNATWGWTATPSPINRACSLMAARYVERTKQALFGFQSFADVGAAAIRTNDPDYARLIAPYTRPMVA